jgi:hypothetical protein
MPEDRTLRLRVRWTAPPLGATEEYRAFLEEHGLDKLEGFETEFGMQRGRREVVSGLPQLDGSITFETEVQPYRDKAGRQRFRGEFVQGPPAEPFLYLSWRVAGEESWIARTKIQLSPLTDELIATLPDDAVLETDVTRFGHRSPGQVQEWRAI